MESLLFVLIIILFIGGLYALSKAPDPEELAEECKRQREAERIHRFIA
ncbi:MAG: hypothetical protein ACWGOV_09285 [Acidiferrobacterales bacterium]